MVKSKQILAAVLLSFLSAFSYTTPVFSMEANSTNYGVSEVNFNSGGVLNACSTAYCSRQAAGETVVGNTSSTSYQAQGGANTNRDPVLEMSVSSGIVNLGDLDQAATKSGTTTFSVRTFPAYGYNIIVDGVSLKNKTSGYVLAPMSAMANSQPGTEQFGLNLRQNTTPAIGADVQHDPNSTFAFGAASTGYGTQNNYKYTAGDVIAQSAKGTGKTNYTMSVIANIASNTPGGVYSGRLVLIAVPTF